MPTLVLPQVDEQRERIRVAWHGADGVELEIEDDDVEPAEDNDSELADAACTDEADCTPAGDGITVSGADEGKSEDSVSVRDKTDDAHTGEDSVCFGNEHGDVHEDDGKDKGEGDVSLGNKQSDGSDNHQETVVLPVPACGDPAAPSVATSVKKRPAASVDHISMKKRPASRLG